jgi:glutaredoxin
MNKRISTLLALVSLLLVFSAHAEIHKWVDSEGNVHFGARPPSSGHSEIVHVNVTRPSALASSPKTERVNSSVEAPKKSVKREKVTMYGTDWCSYCKKARNYFNKKGIPFVEYNVEKLPRRMREFKKLGGSGYPLIVISKNNKMHGFSESGFERRYNQ